MQPPASADDGRLPNTHELLQASFQRFSWFADPIIIDGGSPLHSIPARCACLTHWPAVELVDRPAGRARARLLLTGVFMNAHAMNCKLPAKQQQQQRTWSLLWRAAVAAAVLAALAAVPCTAASELSGPHTIRSQAGPDAAGPGRCLVFGDNGNDRFPQRFSWDDGPWCGLPSAAVLLDNKQAAFAFDLIPGTTDM